MDRTKRRAAGAVVIVVSVVSVAFAGPVVVARADGGPSASPSTAAPSAPVKVDPTSPRLKLPEGATLAPAKVLDIVAVTDQSSTKASQPEQRHEESNTSITYALQADVLFGKDSAALSAAATSRIKAIAGDINAKNVSSPIRVFGFTDNLGSEEHGEVLSKQRADAVYGVLASALGSAGGANRSFQVRGYGEDYPIADNSTEVGRRQNRRVEITFTPSGA
ncbi:OmpA family protein [Streptomyces sp. H39-S7]|uniref:OmpA family protein n=1 Tax=Streptomyces sp. H39-S7 TaxID=3004357 RepID=UPI0022AFD7B9|nr:OmpA family protein [Streptomyces sp. H39-S7]MCZ4122044.1 OmpA family protein [Streptomyces sp. H39-S7]